ncbi:glycosyltransferase [Algiphilus sp.]|uniref:glycosyltransferase n=1 Tax=Algiphilus sp. TaxID=1872431 RepID=UPI002A67EA39|nr:glycosyltransferase [Pseudomonadota bacterium]
MEFAYSSPARSSTELDTSARTTATARQLRVAFFSDAEAERNGAGSYYSDLIAQLRHQVDQVEIFQPTRKRRPFSGFSVPLPGDPTQRLLTPNVPALWRQMLRMRPDVVVAITPGPFGLLGLALARRMGCGFFTAFHTEFEALSSLYWNPISRSIANGFLTGVNRLLCSNADATLVHSSRLVDTVRRLGAEQVQIMGTPLPTRFIEEPVEPLRGPLRQLVFAGRLAPEKNIPTIIEAARALPDLRFVIAGDGPLRRQLERETRRLDNVEMVGWLDREALRQLLDASDLLLLPSRLETFGSIALEAMARGRPAIVAENAGIHSWHSLRDGLIPLHGHASLTETIRRVQQQSPAARQDSAERARDAAERLNNETLAHWVSLLDQHAPAR